MVQAWLSGLRVMVTSKQLLWVERIWLIYKVLTKDSSYKPSAEIHRGFSMGTNTSVTAVYQFEAYLSEVAWTIGCLAVLAFDMVGDHRGWRDKMWKYEFTVAIHLCADTCVHLLHR